MSEAEQPDIASPPDVLASEPETAPKEAADSAPAPDELTSHAERDDKAQQPDGAPQEYTFTAPEGGELDAQALGIFEPVAKELGLTQAQAQKLVDIYPQIQQRQAQAWGQQVAEWGEQVKTDPEIGGEKFTANVGQAQKALDQFGNPALRDYLEASGLGNHPELVRFCAKVGKAMAEDNMIMPGHSSERSAVRDLAYSFDVDGFQGNDLTVLANHFFTGFQLLDWAFTITPLSVVWCVRNDGTLLGLTYLREQQVAAWHQHPAAGKYEAVCSISEGTEDALYCVVNRTIQGQPRRYVERLQSRIFERMEEAFFVDCGLSWDGRNHAPGNTLTLSGGQGDWPYDAPMTLTASGARFTAQDVGNAFHFPYQETGDSGRVEHKVLKLTVRAVVNDTTATVTSHRNVPARFQHVLVSDWQRARQTFSGLAHLEGQTVSILSDANVEPPKVVKDGRVTLEAPAGAGAVGQRDNIQGWPGWLRVSISHRHRCFSLCIRVSLCTGFSYPLLVLGHLHQQNASVSF
uniref:Uncharacterized protein n=1 Tax=Sodalis glossinidius TaxID=63612 RepID=Q3C0K3_SODGL|nr:hypothetical protein [Sodalis glossinidius]CAI59394.2 hypothetical protein pSG3.03 [Sodalis glossinidius]